MIKRKLGEAQRNHIISGLEENKAFQMPAQAFLSDLQLRGVGGGGWGVGVTLCLGGEQTELKQTNFQLGSLYCSTT